MKQRIIDSTSGDEVTGRTGRFTTTEFRRGDIEPQTVYEGVRGAKASGRGKRALVTALRSAAAQEETAKRGSWLTVVSLYDHRTRMWWPCRLAE